MEPYSLVAILAGGVALAALFSAFDDDDADTSSHIDETVDDLDDTDPDPTDSDGDKNYVGTAGDDNINVSGDDSADWTVTLVDSGTFLGVENSDGSESYAADGKRGFEDLETGEIVASLPGLTEVDGGAGDDHIKLSGYDVISYDSEGADTIDAANLSQGVILASEGDLVQGTKVPDADVKVLGSDYTFRGRDGSEYAFSGDDAKASGGRGNDTLIAGGDGSLSGDGGDDLLIGNYNRMVEADTGDDLFSYHTNDEANRLYGGTGNDTIVFDFGDTVTGGAGADSLTGFLAPDEDRSVITDFDPDEDSLTLWVNDSAADVTLKEVDGNTQINLNGELLSVIKGQTGLTAGYMLNAANGDSTLVDAAGNTIDASQVDIVIGNYPNVST